MMGLRTAYEEDSKASPAEMLFGAPHRIPGEFFVAESAPADPQVFVERFRHHMKAVKAIPTAYHIKPKLFVLKELHTCSHVFERVNSIKKPLEQPYTDPREVVKRLNDRIYIINIKGKGKAISVDVLKLAFLAATDTPPLQR